ncbi:MAG: glycosyltransferase family 2 protein [Lentisphaerae bacterium]|nr:glycosyltransferase family 2 protein [Lentisphaerota bacterium]
MEEPCLRQLRQDYARLRGADTRPEMSVVIPVFFQEEVSMFLGAICSIMQDNVAPTEIIVVINGRAPEEELRRTDLFRLAEGIGIETLVISYVDREEYREICRPSTIFVPKQAGLEAAKGSIVIAADIDSVVSPGWLRAYFDAFRSDEDLVAAYGPVNLHCDGAWSSRLMTWVSTIVKGAKILLDRPPYAGHNHALRKSAADQVPGLYELIVEDCQEVPAILKSRLGLQGNLTRSVPCIPIAVSTTAFFPQGGLWRWLIGAGCRNARNLGRIRGILRGGSRNGAQIGGPGLPGT